MCGLLAPSWHLAQWSTGSTESVSAGFGQRASALDGLLGVGGKGVVTVGGTADDDELAPCRVPLTKAPAPEAKIAPVPPMAIPKELIMPVVEFTSCFQDSSWVARRACHSAVCCWVACRLCCSTACGIHRPQKPHPSNACICRHSAWPYL